jgi:phosphoglycolate phosphatase
LLSLVGLDLDGTLVDSAPDLSTALGRALESLSLPAPTDAETESWIGDGIESLIARAITNATGSEPSVSVMRAALQVFDAHYAESHFVRSRLYPGVIDTLMQLRRAGLRTACITNKRIAFARPMLEAAKLDIHFDLIYGGDTLARKKPYPDQLNAALTTLGIRPDAAVMVGDSPNDMDAAAAAGWHFIFAGYGYTSAMRNRDAEPLVRIGRFTDLLRILLPS